MVWLNFGSISSAALLPIYTDWLRSRNAQLVVYCPVLCHVALFAAVNLEVPVVSLLTTSGPGYFDAAIASMAGPAAVRGVAAGLVEAIKAVEQNAAAIASIRSQLAMPELTLNTTVLDDGSIVGTAVLDGAEFAKQARLIAAGLERAEGVDGALYILTETAACQQEE